MKTRHHPLDTYIIGYINGLFRRDYHTFITSLPHYSDAEQVALDHFMACRPYLLTKYEELKAGSWEINCLRLFKSKLRSRLISAIQEMIIEKQGINKSYISFLLHSDPTLADEYVATLSERNRVIFYQVFVEGLSYRDIGIRHGVSVGTVGKITDRQLGQFAMYLHGGGFFSLQPGCVNS